MQKKSRNSTGNGNTLLHHILICSFARFFLWTPRMIPNDDVIANFRDCFVFFSFFSDFLLFTFLFLQIYTGKSGDPRNPRIIGSLGNSSRGSPRSGIFRVQNPRGRGRKKPSPLHLWNLSTQNNSKLTFTDCIVRRLTEQNV